MRTVEVCPRANSKASLARGCSGGAREEVGEDKTVACDNFAHFNGDGRCEHWAVTGKGMKFTVFAARVDTLRKIGQEILVESAARETGVEFFGIYAGEIGAEASGEHFFGENSSAEAPKGKDRSHIALCEILFAVLANVFEE